MVIKVVLMLGIAGAALLLLRGYSGARHQAIRRLLLLAFTAAAGASLLVPQLWTSAASLLGVGRGTDLLLYLTIVTFLGFVATSYLRFRDLQRQITAMARRLALDEAMAAPLGQHAPQAPARSAPVQRAAAAAPSQGPPAAPAGRAAPATGSGARPVDGPRAGGSRADRSGPGRSARSHLAPLPLLDALPLPEGRRPAPARLRGRHDPRTTHP